MSGVAYTAHSPYDSTNDDLRCAPPNLSNKEAHAETSATRCSSPTRYHTRLGVNERDRMMSFMSWNTGMTAKIILA